jgi:hypothetical protein
MRKYFASLVLLIVTGGFVLNAQITSPQVVKFSNERARVLADLSVETYETAKSFQAEWDALGGVASSAQLIEDGSAEDGRKRVTADQLRTMNTVAGAMVSFFEAGTPSRISQIRAISVNGQARF